jgi:glycosyltransferase involved in cell wall biosynthesis
MKIAHISPLIENTGGHRILYEHICGLRKLGHHVDFYASGWAGTYAEEWLNMPGIIFYKTMIDGSPSSFPLVLKDEYELVVANMLSGAEEVLPLSHHNKVYFYQNHDALVFQDRTRELVEKAERIYNDYDKHLVYSHALKEIVLGITPKADIHVCTNGVTYKKFHPYQKISKNKQPRVCYMAAYQGILKGAKLAGDVFEELQRRGFTTVCLMANHQPIRNSDEFYSNPPFEQKARLVAGCDVFLHPSVFETWCLATMEAMALGTPVVGTDSMGIREYMDDTNSVIVKERNACLLCDEIEKLVEDESRYDELVKNSIETARKHDWEIVMPKIEQTYKELI